MQNCVSIVEIRSYARGELSENEASELRLHVKGCAACMEEVRAFLRVRAALSGKEQKPLPDCLSTDDLLALLKSEDLDEHPQAVEHLLLCADCRGRLAAAREDWGSPLPEAPESSLNAAITAVAHLHTRERSETALSKRTRRTWSPGGRPATIRWLAAAACLLLVLGVFVAWRLYDQSSGKVVLCEGTVTVQQVNGSAQKAAVGDKVPFGRRISASAGAVCQIQYSGGLQLSLREQSRLRLADPGHFELELGTVHVNARERGEIEVRTAQGSVTAPNASFALSVDEGRTLLQMVEGQALFKNAHGSKMVGPLEESVAMGDQAPRTPQPTSLAHIWRIDNRHPQPLVKWVALDGFESLKDWRTYPAKSEGRTSLNAEAPQEGKACVRIHRLLSDAGPIGIWRELTLPPGADRVRLWVRKKSSCPMAILSIQLRATTDFAGPSNCYHLFLGDMPNRWVPKELDLQKDACVQEGAALQPTMVKAISILCSAGPADVLIDNLECRVVERR